VGGIGIIIFVQVGGLLFDLIGPPAPFLFTGIGNLLILSYAAWVQRVDQDRGSEQDELAAAVEADPQGQEL
jgi:hypothetical protein